jgi:hypothetical protein
VFFGEQLGFACLFIPQAAVSGLGTTETTGTTGTTGTTETGDDHEEEKLKMKRRSLSTMCFIGELFKAKMLSSEIVHHCISTVMNSKREDGCPDEERVEFVCKLLQNVGQELDNVLVRVFG